MAKASAPSSSMLIELQPGESLDLPGTGVRVEVVQKSGRAARLRVTAPRSVPINKVAQIQPDREGEAGDFVPIMAT